MGDEGMRNLAPSLFGRGPGCGHFDYQVKSPHLSLLPKGERLFLK
jgi:hypothetical protein